MFGNLSHSQNGSLSLFFFFSFIFISWRLITLQYCSGFCHTLTWISHGFTCIPHPNPSSHLPLYPMPLFCLSFYLLYFVLPPFEDSRLPFWVPDVLCQRSEVVSWNSLTIQMFFWWICGGESGLPILFLHHLKTTPISILKKEKQKAYVLGLLHSCSHKKSKSEFTVRFHGNLTCEFSKKLWMKTYRFYMLCAAQCYSLQWGMMTQQPC